MLAKGREKSLLRRHPWIFSGAVARMEGKASLGETIDIVDHQVKRRTKNAKTFHDKCENFNFRASNETAALTAVFLFITWGHFGYG